MQANECAYLKLVHRNKWCRSGQSCENEYHCANGQSPNLANECPKSNAAIWAGSGIRHAVRRAVISCRIYMFAAENLPREDLFHSSKVASAAVGPVDGIAHCSIPSIDNARQLYKWNAQFVFAAGNGIAIGGPSSDIRTGYPEGLVFQTVGVRVKASVNKSQGRLTGHLIATALGCPLTSNLRSARRHRVPHLSSRRRKNTPE